jgi:hypothetical protein
MHGGRDVVLATFVHVQVGLMPGVVGSTGGSYCCCCCCQRRTRWGVPMRLLHWIRVLVLLMMAGLLLLMWLLILLLIWRLITAAVATVVILLLRRVTRKQDWDILLRNIGPIHIRQPHKVVSIIIIVAVVIAHQTSLSFFTNSVSR